MQSDLTVTNANFMRTSAELGEMSLSHSQVPSFAGPGLSDFEVPIQIGSDDFILQIGNIRNIEVIDMNQSVLDQVNANNTDTQFFKTVFDSVNK